MAREFEADTMVAVPIPYIPWHGIKWRNPPSEAGLRTQYFYKHKKGMAYSVLEDKGGGGLDILLGWRTWVWIV
jgi:hypothetical protein